MLCLNLFLLNTHYSPLSVRMGDKLYYIYTYLGPTRTEYQDNWFSESASNSNSRLDFIDYVNLG